MKGIDGTPDWDAELVHMREWSLLMHEHLARGIDWVLDGGVRLAIEQQPVDRFIAQCGVEISWGLVRGVALVKTASVNAR